MGNKWQICIDVTQGDVNVLVSLLEDEVSGLQSALELISDAKEWQTVSDHIHNLEKLRSDIKLAWIEREVEIIPPPSQWSDTLPVAVDSDVLRRDAPYPTREMKREWHEHFS